MLSPLAELFVNFFDKSLGFVHGLVIYGDDTFFTRLGELGIICQLFYLIWFGI